MPEARTRDYGAVPYEETDVIELARPLPGFPGQLRFLMLRPRPEAGWIVLQSLDDAATALLTLPAEMVDPDYEAQLTAEDHDALGWREGAPRALVLVTVAAGTDGRPAANLLGPIVVDPARRRGLQAIREDRRYGAAEPVPLRCARNQEEVPCS